MNGTFEQAKGRFLIRFIRLANEQRAFLGALQTPTRMR